MNTCTNTRSHLSRAGQGLILAAVLLLAPVPAAADGEGFETDVFTVASYDEPDAEWVCVDRNEDGLFVIVWHHGDKYDETQEVYARRYGADGAPLGDVFLVNDLTEGNQSRPSVAVREDGSFIVAWSDTGPGNGIYARIFDAAGDPAGPSFQVNDPNIEGSQSLGHRSVAALPGDRFIVTWGLYDRGIWARIYEPDGTPSGEPFQVTSDSDASSPSLSVRGDDVLFSWLSRFRIYGRLYDDLGNPRGDAFLVDETTDCYPYRPAGEVRPRGDYVFGYHWSWYDDEGYTVGVAARHVARDGTTLEEIDPDTSGRAYSWRGWHDSWRHQPVSDRWNRVLLTWTAFGPGYVSTGDRIRARRYGEDLQPHGSDFLVSPPPGSDDWRGYPSAAADADGDIVIAWSWFAGNPYQVRARLLCATLDTVGPENTDACEGGRAELHVETRGHQPFTWQWRRDGTDLQDGGNVSGAGTDTLVLDPVSATDGGTYDCVVADGCPDTQHWTSASATLTVHGAIPEVPGLRLRKESGGSELHFTWQNVENAVDYVVRQDTAPDGPFDTITGTATDGTAGLTIPMPAETILYFIVRGRNPGCEGP